MVRFIHTADWQLGMGRSYLDPTDALPRFQHDRVEVIRRIAEAARDTGAAFVVVSGDVFETNQVNPRTVQWACEALATVPVPVYLLPGNHDPLDGASVFHSATFLDAVPDNVVVLLDGQPVPVPGAAAEIVGAPWFSKAPTTDLAAAALAELMPAAPDTVRILVAHGAVDAGVAPDRESVSVIQAAALQAAIDDGRIDFVALGDRHSTWQVPGHDRVWYAGAPEPTAFREVDAGNILLVDIEPGGTCDVTTLAVGSWRFELLEEELRDAASVDRLDATLAAISDRARAIVRCKLTGVVSLATRTRLDTMLESHRHALACLDLPDRHDNLLIEPDEADLAKLDLRGYAAAALDELRAADDPVATEALAQLYRIAQEVTA